MVLVASAIFFAVLAGTNVSRNASPSATGSRTPRPRVCREPGSARAAGRPSSRARTSPSATAVSRSCRASTSSCRRADIARPGRHERVGQVHAPANARRPPPGGGGIARGAGSPSRRCSRAASPTWPSSTPPASSCRCGRSRSCAMARYPERGACWDGCVSEDRDLVAWAMETMGVRELAGSPLRSLSGGQQQRVYLAQVAGAARRPHHPRRAHVRPRRRRSRALPGGVRGGACAGCGDRHRDPRHRRGGRVRPGAAARRRVVALGRGVGGADRGPAAGDVRRSSSATRTRSIAGRFVVAERTHGAPQIVDVGRDVEP